jgi:hypothetical protein
MLRDAPAIEPPHAPPELPARIVSHIPVLAPGVLSWKRPPPAAAPLAAIVACWSWSEPPEAMPPPLAAAVLPLSVA